MIPPTRDPSSELRALVRLAAALAAGDDGSLEPALDEALANADPIEVEEVILQSYLFLGFPAVLNGLARWRERAGPVAGPRAASDVGRAQWMERGERVCRTVYGESYERLRENVRRLHVDLEHWMLEEGYGKVLGRPGLPLARRELCIVAQLARVGPVVERQLHAHLRGALRAGAPASHVELALGEGIRGLDPAHQERALALWRSIRPPTDPSSPSPSPHG